MRRALEGVILIGGFLLFESGDCYSCSDTSPTAALTNQTLQSVCVGEAPDFNAVGVGEDATGSYDDDNGAPYGGGHGIYIYGWWFADSDEWDYDSGGKPSHDYNAPGRYDVWMCVYDDDAGTKSDANVSCSVFVVEVNNVEDASTGVEDHTYVSVYDTARLVAVRNPSEASWPQKQPRWSIVSQPSGADAKVTPVGYFPDPNDRWGPLADVTDMNVPGDYVIQASCGSEDPPDNNMVVTAYAVESVSWKTYPDDVPGGNGGANIGIDGCPQNGGKRIFPGKKVYNDTEDEGTMRKKVRVEAKITPAVDNRHVYFSVWDVDDPNSDPDIDDNDANGVPTGGDNRGSHGGLSTTEAVTDGDGYARVTFTVSMKPGDNFRIAASGISYRLGLMTQSMADTNSPPEGVKLSEMLTVWRKLHLELDSMVGGEDNPVSGRDILATWPDVPHDGESGADINDWSGDRDEGQYEGGTFTVDGESFEILDNIGETVYVDGNVCGHEGSLASFGDDDECALPRKSNWGLMNSKFRPAYVEAVEEADVYDANVSFVANLTDPCVSSIAGPVKDRPTSMSYWVTQILSAHQGARSYDGDPDTYYHFHSGESYKDGDQSVHGGVSPQGPSGENLSVVFLESLRDYAAQLLWLSTVTEEGSITVYTAAECEQVTVVHEVGHVFGCIHIDFGIMKGGEEMSPGLGFTPKSINRIRSNDP